VWYEYYRLPEELMISDFEQLWNLHPATFHRVVIYGKEFLTPKIPTSFLVEITSFRKLLPSNPVPDFLQPFLDFFSQKYKIDFNMLLLKLV